MHQRRRIFITAFPRNNHEVVVTDCPTDRYFYYGCYICCGLPSVTLLGQQADWQRLITKAKRLPTFGKECATWHSLLMPVLKRFVSSFESSESEETKDFWQKIAHYSGGGSGPTYLSVCLSHLPTSHLLLVLLLNACFRVSFIVNSIHAP